MNYIPKEERSDLSVYFRERAVKALRQWKAEQGSACPHLAGIQWGEYVAFKVSSDILDLDIISTKRNKPISVDHLTRDEHCGTPVHINQPVDSASYQQEAGNRPTLSPTRANPHD